MEPIPLRCVDCPFIAPTLDRLRDLLAEEEILETQRARLTEYVNAEAIDVRLEQIGTELGEIDRELSTLIARTIGCAGVALTQARSDDSLINALHCQSPLQ